MITIKKGLSLSIAGGPAPEIQEGPPVGRVGLLGDDYIGMRPTMAVREGDSVKLGQLLFTDRKNSVRYTSPGSGKVTAIHRGAKRKFESIVIDLEGEEEETFPSCERRDLPALEREKVRETLVNSGLWTALRTRPFSKVPSPDSVPHSIFVAAMDTNPLAADVERIVGESQEDFVLGLEVLSRLTDGKVFVCKREGADIPVSDLAPVSLEEFSGPHPAGLPGTHIHFLDPVSHQKTVWYTNYQDVMAMGKLFLTGKLSVGRVISLAGPAVKNPRLIRTRMGASLDDLTRGELGQAGDQQTDVRVISGSVLSGRQSRDSHCFLGRYHLQISAIAEGREREFLNWVRPGFNRFSVKRVFASALLGSKKEIPFTTSAEGSERAMVPVGSYEKVMPLDILPTFLLRALITGDTEQAQALGCLELDEDDVALCSFVCPGKYEYGPLLRSSLTSIEKEG